MKIKLCYICACFTLTVLSASAQKKLTKEVSISVKKHIIEKSKKTNSISSDFIQSKHLSFLAKDIISKGSLTFKSPNLIKWTYVKPFDYSVVFKENKLLINDGGTKSDIDLSANKTFKELNGLIVKSVKGDMFDEEKFNITYYQKDKNYLIVFDTVDESIKDFIGVFELTFDGESYSVLEIKMKESSEDYTTIKFVNQKVNKEISDAIFTD